MINPKTLCRVNSEEEKRVLSKLFHFYEVLGQEKLIYGACTVEGCWIVWEGVKAKVLGTRNGGVSYTGGCICQIHWIINIKFVHFTLCKVYLKKPSKTKISRNTQCHADGRNIYVSVYWV